jgi:hypothetical protein
MILAMNGADFGEFGASQSIGDLQTALVALGKGIGDTTLSKIVVDGIMGPKTAAATNRALTIHLGAGQAPANLRTGSLSQAVITSQAATITQLLEAEVSRRGFATPVSKKIVAKTTRPKVTPAPAVYTPPAATYAPAVYTPSAMVPIAPAAVAPVYRVPAQVPAGGGTDLGAVMKWAVIGVGAVVVLGVGYYFATRKRGPAMAGFGAFGMKGDRINNHERELWINNDEGLYNWFKRERISMREFIKRNRAEIDAAIRGVVDREPARARF